MKKKRARILFIILFFMLITGCTGCVISCFKVTTYYGNDTSNYLSYDWPLHDGGTPYKVSGFFPEDLSSVSEVVDYYYRAEFPAGFIGTYWELVLRVKYNDENYEQEIQRLHNYITNDDTSPSDGDQNETSDVVNCDLFYYETFIMTYRVSRATFGTQCYYIYAILDRENNEIVYVYLKSPVLNKHNPYLDSKYLPINYFKNEKKKSAVFLEFYDYHYIPEE